MVKGENSKNPGWISFMKKIASYLSGSSFGASLKRIAHFSEKSATPNYTDNRDIYYAKYYGRGGGGGLMDEKIEKGKEKRGKITLKTGGGERP